MNKTMIKQPRYMAGTSINGYGVWDTETMGQLYTKPFSADRNVNVDTEVDMSKIAGLLNVTKSPAADDRLIESINAQLKEFEQYKCHD